MYGAVTGNQRRCTATTLTGVIVLLFSTTTAVARSTEQPLCLHGEERSIRIAMVVNSSLPITPFSYTVAARFMMVADPTVSKTIADFQASIKPLAEYSETINEWRSKALAKCIVMRRGSTRDIVLERLITDQLIGNDARERNIETSQTDIEQVRDELAARLGVQSKRLQSVFPQLGIRSLESQLRALALRDKYSAAEIKALRSNAKIEERNGLSEPLCNCSAAIRRAVLRKTTLERRKAEKEGGRFESFGATGPWSIQVLKSGPGTTGCRAIRSTKLRPSGTTASFALMLTEAGWTTVGVGGLDTDLPPSRVSIRFDNGRTARSEDRRRLQVGWSIIRVGSEVWRQIAGRNFVTWTGYGFSAKIPLSGSGRAVQLLNDCKRKHFQ